MKGIKLFVLYIAIKWILFYVYQFTSSNPNWSFEKANGEGVFLAAFMLLILPLVEVVVLFFPFQWALKQRSWLMILFLIMIFGLEFFIGWFATNQHFEIWMFVKLLLSISLFLFVYREQIKFQ